MVHTVKETLNKAKILETNPRRNASTQILSTQKNSTGLGDLPYNFPTGLEAQTTQSTELLGELVVQEDVMAVGGSSRDYLEVSFTPGAGVVMSSIDPTTVEVEEVEDEG